MSRLVISIVALLLAGVVFSLPDKANRKLDKEIGAQLWKRLRSALQKVEDIEKKQYNTGYGYGTSSGSGYGTGYGTNAGSGYGYGTDYGSGYGYGTNSGSGYGYGTYSGYGANSGSGYGYGADYGTGYGYGTNSGSGYGYGSNYGTGYGYGTNYGSGYGYGTDYGTGYGYGTNSGSGYGYGTYSGSGYGYGTYSGYGYGTGDGTHSSYGYGTQYGAGHGSNYANGHATHHETDYGTSYGSGPGQHHGLLHDQYFRDEVVRFTADIFKHVFEEMIHALTNPGREEYDRCTEAQDSTYQYAYMSTDTDYDIGWKMEETVRELTQIINECSTTEVYPPGDVDMLTNMIYNVNYASDKQLALEDVERAYQTEKERSEMYHGYWNEECERRITVRDCSMETLFSEIRGRVAWQK